MSPSIHDMQRLADAAAAAHGGIDILCANAGIFPQAKIEDLSPEDWDHVMATNLKGTFLAIKACLPHLKKSDQGRVVLTSSITGPITGFPGWSHYGATKAGQLGFMRTACIELAKLRHHRQCNTPWQHSDRELDGARTRLRAFDGGFHPAQEAGDG